MYCFNIKPSEAYSGGCVIVAANNATEAMEEFRKNKFYDDLCRTDVFTCNIVPGLEYDTDTPKVIIDEIYIE